MAHRGNVEGAGRVVENSLAACAEALELGFGLELDLRRTGSGRFYISHDPAPVAAANAVESYSPLLGAYPSQLIAVNVKDPIPELELIHLQRAGLFGANTFYFDFELLESEEPGRAQRAIRGLPGGHLTRLAARISDRREPIDQCLSIEAEYVWADEFDGSWIVGADIQTLQSAGRKVIAVSPELHGRPDAERLRRWEQFKEWGIDGLCTDFCVQADVFFNDRANGRF